MRGDDCRRKYRDRWGMREGWRDVTPERDASQFEGLAATIGAAGRAGLKKSQFTEEQILVCRLLRLSVPGAPSVGHATRR